MTSGTGTCSVMYDQAGSADYNAAPQVVESVTAQKASQMITVATHAPAGAVFGTSFGVAASAPGGSVSFSSAGACYEFGEHVHDDERHGDVLGDVRPGRERELQRGAAGGGVGGRG